MQSLLKYPRTYHLPNSLSLQNDDRRLPSMAGLRGRTVRATEKMDGEGATLARERTYPRSPDGRPHPSRNWIKARHARIAHDIPEAWRISCEYMYALHSIAYTRENGNALRSYLYGFGVWNEDNVLMGIHEQDEVFAMLDIEPAPILYEGPYHDGLVEELAAGIDPTRQEGFVLRDAGPIPYPSGQGDTGRFFSARPESPVLAKWVRAKHVATDQHWMSNWRDAPGFVNELLESVSPAP